MAHIKLVNEADFSPDALEAAILLYKSTWGGIMKAELGLSSEAGLIDMLKASHAARMAIFPEGQRAVIDAQKGMPVGTINSLLYDSSNLPFIQSWNQLTGEGTHRTHIDCGDALICVAIQTSQSGGAARKLVEAQADLAKRLGKKLFVFTRPNGYAAYLRDNSGVTIEQYLELIVKRGLERSGDGVSFHHHIGAVLAPLLHGNKPYLHNSRPGDASSLRYNVLMQYPL